MIAVPFPVVTADAVAQPATPPRLVDGVPIITYSDYPAAAMRANEFGIVSVLLLINTAGRAVSCKVTETSRSVALDDATCRLFGKRGRFQPGLDAGGHAIDAPYRAAVAWGQDANQPRVSFNVPLTVAAVPAGYAKAAKVQLQFDAGGHATECVVTASSGSGTADAAVCRYLLKQFVVTPPRSGSDATPVAIRFVTATLNSEVPAK